MKNRLGIYFFYDKDGVVDDYVTYYLENLKPHLSELCVVVNEFLNDEGRNKLEKVADKLIVRQNIGYDSGAYKEAMESYGYDKLKEYDELLLCNFTCFGPVYPFQEMFDKMDAKKCDFWGITKYPRRDKIKLSPKQKTNYIPEHVMSYFLVIRNSILKNNCFKKYWDDLQIAADYAEAIVFNELIFTDYFESRGFKSEVFMSRKTIDRLDENSAAFTPIELLKERCPLVKRRAFSAPYYLYITYGNGTSPRKTLDYIKNNTDYNIDLIWKNLIRTMKGSELKRNLHLNYFFDENKFEGNVEELKKNKTALLLYSYYEDMVDYAFSYAKNLPEWVDIYIFVVSKTAKLAFEKEFSKLPNKVTVEIKENRGQLASAVMVSGKHIFENYDLVCVTQTKKSTQLRDMVDSEDFCNHCWDNVLKTPEYVLNILKAFNDNPYMGYACSVVMHTGSFFWLPGRELCGNRENMLNLLEEKFKIPKDFMDDEPVASYGECYWVRAKAYKTLLSYPWTHEDFPEAEKTPKDGCILNALERLNPIFVQYDGYYPCWIGSLSDIHFYLDNIYYLHRQDVVRERESEPSGYYQSVSSLFSLKRPFYKFMHAVSLGKHRKKMKEKYNKYRLYIKKQ